MNPQEVGARLVALLGAGPTPSPGEEATPAAVAGVSGGERYARATVDVPAAAWTDAVRAARDDAELACDFFDWLSAVDELTGGPAAGRGGDGGDDDGPFNGFTVVTHLWSTTHRHGLLLRTRVPRDAPAVPSIVDVYPGAAWHERETHEMFGVDFPGHPGPLTSLLLPAEFEGHPLRKEFVLASRVAKDWPGAKEPGESESGTKRAKMRPPGVPDPSEWGPHAAAPAAPPSVEPPAPAAAPPAGPDGGGA